jgi:hypothetical protein
MYVHTVILHSEHIFTKNSLYITLNNFLCTVYNFFTVIFFNLMSDVQYISVRNFQVCSQQFAYLIGCVVCLLHWFDRKYIFKFSLSYVWRRFMLDELNSFGIRPLPSAKFNRNLFKCFLNMQADKQMGRKFLSSSCKESVMNTRLFSLASVSTSLYSKVNKVTDRGWTVSVRDQEDTSSSSTPPERFLNSSQIRGWVTLWPIERKRLCFTVVYLHPFWLRQQIKIGRFDQWDPAEPIVISRILCFYSDNA